MTSCWSKMTNISYRKRLAIYLALFLFYIVQLATYQSQLRHRPEEESTDNVKYLVTVNVLMVVIAAVALSCGWVFRPYFEKQIISFNSTIFGLTFGWLILAAPLFSSHVSFYVINAFIAVLLILTDVCALLYVRPQIFSIKALTQKKIKNVKSASNVSYGKINDNFPTIDEGDLEMARGVSEETSRKAGHLEENVALGGFQVDTTNKEICEGFRVNISKLPVFDANIPRDLQWDAFGHIQHIVDSSSCHIYTALWKEIPVVLKLIKAERLSSAVAVAEFDIEENVLSRIRHPNIIRLLGSGLQPRKFLVLELLSGGSLSHTLGLRPDSNNQVWIKKFSYAETLRVALALAKALRYLHHEWSPSVHIIHRDLKPDNIGWTADGVLKLFDFGLCASVRAQKEKTEQYRLTGNTGTLRYMAPEVVLGRSYHQSVDTYSFGILVWQIATGKVPFKEMGKKTFFDRVVIGGQRLKLDPKWPTSFCNLLKNCWHEDKAARPSFVNIVVELEALVQSEEELMKMKRNKIGNKCTRRFQQSLYWSRPGILLILLIIFVVSLVAVIGRDDTIAGAALGSVSSFGMYAVLMTYLKATPDDLLPPRGGQLENSAHAVKEKGYLGKTSVDDNKPSLQSNSVPISMDKETPSNEYAFNPLNKVTQRNVPMSTIV